MLQMRRLVKFQMSSCLILGLKKFSLYCILSAFFLSNFSCESPKKSCLIDKEDREVVDTFLRYIAISEVGIYTILGSKPVTEFDIPQVRTKDQLKAQYEKMPERFRKKISFKKYDTTKEIEKLREACDKWVQLQHKYVGEHFVIHFDEKMHSCYLVNIPLVIYILREHYEDFSKVLGTNFDPEIVAKEIGNDSASFWKIFKDNSNAYLMGLLFGYGEKNSKLFQWEKEKSISFPFRVVSYRSPWLKKRRVFGCAIREDVENLDIPQFIVYQPVDEIVGRYLFEKEQILQIYKKRDFAETTVAFLKGDAVHQLSNRKKPVDAQQAIQKSAPK